jgi:PadR family transcriptional regulator PadR
MPRPRNTSPQTMALLAALAAEPKAWRYGLSLSKETGLKSGTLYPILMRLADSGLLEAKWAPPEKPGRPARHIYRLSASGLALVREQSAATRGKKRLRPLLGET